MQFVQWQSALATYWTKVKRTFENHLPSLRFAKETSDGATEDTLEPEPFLVPSVPSKADFQAQVSFDILAVEAGHGWSDALMPYPLSALKPESSFETSL
jgi:hypothetical protein